MKRLKHPFSCFTRPHKDIQSRVKYVVYYLNYLEFWLCSNALNLQSYIFCNLWKMLNAIHFKQLVENSDRNGTMVLEIKRSFVNTLQYIMVTIIQLHKTFMTQKLNVKCPHLLSWISSTNSDGLWLFRNFTLWSLN